MSVRLDSSLVCMSLRLLALIGVLSPQLIAAFLPVSWRMLLKYRCPPFSKSVGRVAFSVLSGIVFLFWTRAPVDLTSARDDEISSIYRKSRGRARASIGVVVVLKNKIGVPGVEASFHPPGTRRRTSSRLLYSKTLPASSSHHDLPRPAFF